MSRNATPSWSGYCHQGKVGLLIALRKINSLHGTGQNLADFSLEYETQEDVKISHLTTVLEVHQVKAYGDGTTIGPYKKALREFEDCNGVNCLHSICEITNWGTLTAVQNPKNVTRYRYTAALDYCPLDDIYSYLDAEIQLLLVAEAHNELENAGYRENSYQEFLSELDERIRFEHANGAGMYNVRFTLDEIRTIVIAPPAKVRSRTFAIRKKLYEKFTLFLAQLAENDLPLGDEHIDRVTKAILGIYNLPDKKFIQFLKNINPHTTNGKNFETCELTDDFFFGDSFYGTFLVTMIKVNAVPYRLDNKSIPSYFKAISYLMTTISSDPLQMKFHARDILLNDSVDFTAYANEYLITQSYEGSLMGIATKIIVKDPRKFMNKKDMKFIKMDNAIDILNTP